MTLVEKLLAITLWLVCGVNTNWWTFPTKSHKKLGVNFNVYLAINTYIVHINKTHVF